LAEDPYTTYVHGMWLEGADWDIENKLLIETTKSERFIKFPAIRVRTVIKKKRSPKDVTPVNESSIDSKSDINVRHH